MSPAFVPSIKAMAQCIDLRAATEVTDQVMRMRTVTEVKDYLTERIHKICPNVAFLDTTR